MKKNGNGGCCLAARATCSVPEARASGVLLGQPPQKITSPLFFDDDDILVCDGEKDDVAGSFR